MSTSEIIQKITRFTDIGNQPMLPLSGVEATPEQAEAVEETIVAIQWLRANLQESTENYQARGQKEKTIFQKQPKPKGKLTDYILERVGMLGDIPEAVTEPPVAEAHSCDYFRAGWCDC